MVSVKLYYRPGCPKCDMLIEELSRLSIELGFQFEPVLVDTSFEVFYTKDPASKIYENPEWFEEYATEEQKKLYEEAKPIFDAIGRATIVPVIEIRWFYGLAERSIVIKGFSEKDARKALSNISAAILQLISLERRAGLIR